MAALPWAERLEPILWWAALATWLMMFGAFVREAVRPLEGSIRRSRIKIWLKKRRGKGSILGKAALIAA